MFPVAVPAEPEQSWHADDAGARAVRGAGALTPVLTNAAGKPCCPDAETAERIILDDAGRLAPDETLCAMLKLAQQAGQEDVLALLRSKCVSHPQKDRTFHYLPYCMDSALEQAFFEQVLTLPELASLQLEVYYNGDRELTDVRIRCYRRCGDTWRYVGLYTPDFMLLRRRGGDIDQVLVIETKGSLYAHDPTVLARRVFMETEFLKENNAAFGYTRFGYLYLEDTLTPNERIEKAHRALCAFFGAH